MPAGATPTAMLARSLSGGIKSVGMLGSMMEPIDIVPAVLESARLPPNCGCLTEDEIKEDLGGVEFTMEGSLVDRWERDPRVSGDSPGKLCLSSSAFSFPPRRDGSPLSFHMPSEQIGALERLPAVFHPTLKQRFYVMVGFMTSGRITISTRLHSSAVMRAILLAVLRSGEDLRFQ